MIWWFISTIRADNSGLKYWCTIEYIELDHRKKVNHIKLLLYDEILHLQLTLNPDRMMNSNSWHRSLWFTNMSRLATRPMRIVGTWWLVASPPRPTYLQPMHIRLKCHKNFFSRKRHSTENKKCDVRTNRVYKVVPKYMNFTYIIRLPF